MNIRLARWCAALTIGAGTMVGSLHAQPPAGQRVASDPFDAARAQQRIAEQRARADVVAAASRADELARTSPVRAAQVLREAQTSINQSPALSADSRKVLNDLLTAKLAALDGKAGAKAGAKPDPAGRGVQAANKSIVDNYLREVREVQDGLGDIQRYRDANRPKDVDRVIADLRAKYPDNPAVIYLGRKENLARNVADSQSLTLLQRERLVKVQNDVIKSSIPPSGDIEFPADWKEKTKNRTTDVPLSAKEKEIIEALNKPVTLAVKEQTLEYALQELSNQIGQPISIDTKSLTDLNIDLKRGASIEGKGMTARTALRQVLGAAGLTFVVRDQTIQVVTVERARDLLVTRVYYLGDVVQGVGPFGGSLTWGPFLDYQQTLANVEVLMDSIRNSIDPDSWRGKGGAGSITFHFPSMSLIVRASSEVHSSLGNKLNGK